MDEILPLVRARSGMETRPYGKSESVGCGFHAAP